MISEYRSKSRNILFIASLTILAIGLLALIYLPVIFQEGNPWPEIKGIFQLKFGNREIVQLSVSDNIFMTENKNGTAIYDFMKSKGYEFTEQMGSGYFFESHSGQSVIATRRNYSRYYSLWNIMENKTGSLMN